MSTRWRRSTHVTIEAAASRALLSGSTMRNAIWTLLPSNRFRTQYRTELKTLAGCYNERHQGENIFEALRIIWIEQRMETKIGFIFRFIFLHAQVEDKLTQLVLNC